MPNSSASLDRLPTELLSHIAGHVSEKEIWMMMGTCNSLRRVMEGELKPYLKERAIAVNDPALSNDRYSQLRIDRNAGMDDSHRHKLQEITRKFSRHLTAYPAASLALRRLVIEVGDDDFAVGWRQAAQAGSSLEELEIRVNNSAWQTQQGSRPHQATPPAKVPPRLLENIQRDTGSAALFPNLTTFTITATYHPFHLFAELAGHMPWLRDLTVKSHYGYERRYPSIRPVDFGANTTFPHLERICINTPAVDICRILPGLHPLSPTVRSIVLVGTPYTDTVNARLAIHAARIYPLLTQLALYGQWSVSDFPRSSNRGRSFAGLTALALERCAAQSSYPFLDTARIDRPDFPAIRRITWVDRSTDHEKQRFPTSTTPTLSTANDIRLRGLFNQYTTLEQVVCLADYPADPFAEPDTSSTNGSVLFYASRSDICD